ncbi:MAG: bifunctional folylpolyglutamate synthase/dihydrofolate synthase [Actinobacteria bacterium]|nr:MAG: bifunctional folylpolyglutamate synthase/dihydrofolate synthase [Actinomycetota bacterium]
MSAPTEGSRTGAKPFSPRQAERYLLSLELFGMRFGLDRMRRLTTALGSPQERFDSIHVVGTNGKSSTARMIAAILHAHGLRAGAYLSPHLVSFAERVRVAERDLDEDVFAAAVGRSAHAATLVDRTLAPDDHVTQFEALTAAALDELARQQVDVAVIEAGLGGRYDATNVIPSRVQVLTNVGLEHTRWLGPTILDIAREKLAVVGEGGVLVVGPDLAPDALAVAQETAERQGARVVTADGPGEVPRRAVGRFQRRNFALARAAAQALLEARGAPLREPAVKDAASWVAIPGRLEQIDADPPTLLDGAHNPAGMAALVESLPELIDTRPLSAVVAILDDKDAAAMLALLLPCCQQVVFTAASSPRALSPATLQSLAGQLAGVEGPPAEGRGEPPELLIEPRPARALARAQNWAAERGGVVLATGSIYLAADLHRARAGRRR